MKQITYFQELSFHKFNTPEYVTLMDRFISHTIALGKDTLHYDDADMSRLRELHTQLQNNVAHSSATADTPKLQAIDVDRSSLGQYIISTVRNSITLPITQKATAATALYTILKPYVGFYNQPAPQKTATIDGMLLDLSDERMQEYIETLSLSDTIESLTLKNAQYKVTLEQRTQQRNANKIVDSATLRTEMDALYKYITTLAFAHNVVTPSIDVDTYIATINAIVSETNASYNQRTAKKQTDPTQPPLDATLGEETNGETSEPSEPSESSE